MNQLAEGGDIHVDGTEIRVTTGEAHVHARADGVILLSVPAEHRDTLVGMPDRPDIDWGGVHLHVVEPAPHPYPPPADRPSLPPADALLLLAGLTPFLYLLGGPTSLLSRERLAGAVVMEVLWLVTGGFAVLAASRGDPPRARRAALALLVAAGGMALVELLTWGALYWRAPATFMTPIALAWLVTAAAAVAVDRRR